MDHMERLETIYELDWRLRVCLMTLPSWLENMVISTLEYINPRQREIELRGAKLERGAPIDADQLRGRTQWEIWDQLAVCWVELAFSLLNKAWQTGNRELFSIWTERLTTIEAIKPEWQSRWYFERCWFALFQFDFAALRTDLDRWLKITDATHSPYWTAKQAPFLWFLGDRSRARSIANAALERGRRDWRSESHVYRRRSELGWLLLLARQVRQVWSDDEAFPMNMTAYDDYVARSEELDQQLDVLERYRCDPRTDVDSREELAIGEQPSVRRSNQRGFDPDALSIRMNVHSGVPVSEWILLQTYHDGLMVLNPRTQVVSAILPRCWAENPRLSIALIVLCGDHSVADDFFDRVGVARLSAAQVGAPCIRKIQDLLDKVAELSAPLPWDHEVLVR